MRLRDVRRAVLKRLAAVLYASAEALRRGAEPGPVEPAEKPAAPFEDGGPPAHWLERVKDARMWIGTGPRPTVKPETFSSTRPELTPPPDSTPAPPPAAKTAEKPTEQPRSMLTRPAEGQNDTPPTAAGKTNRLPDSSAGEKKTARPPTPAARLFRIRRAERGTVGDSISGDSQTLKDKKQAPPAPEPFDKPGVEKSRSPRPALRKVAGDNAGKNAKWNAANNTQAERLPARSHPANQPVEQQPIQTNPGSIVEIPRQPVNSDTRPRAGLRFKRPAASTMPESDGPPASQPAWEWTISRKASPTPTPNGKSFSDEAPVRAGWPDLQREEPAAFSPVRAEPAPQGSHTPDLRWADLPPDPTAEQGIEALRADWDAAQREQKHAQKLSREQRGDLWSA